jgi:hypothetical protein
MHAEVSPLCHRALETVRGERKRSSESEQQWGASPSTDVSRTKTPAAAQKLYAQLNQMAATSGGEGGGGQRQRGDGGGVKGAVGTGAPSQPGGIGRASGWHLECTSGGVCGWCVGAGLSAVRALTCM